MKGVTVTMATGLAAGIGVAALWPSKEPKPRAVDWHLHVTPPQRSLRVLWLGHSLMNHRDPEAQPSRNLIEAVNELTNARQLHYEAIDHTLFGSPLSLLWKGSPHGFSRAEPQMRQRREAIVADAARINAVVMTELIPLRGALHREHSAYYAQAFACAVRQKNPQARVYLYETWSHLNASDKDAGYGPPSAWDWIKRGDDDRRYFERLADLAATGQVPAPGFFSRLSSSRTKDCAAAAPIFLVPVGTVFRQIAKQLQTEPLSFQGRHLAISDLFANALTAWPPGWPQPVGVGAEAEKTALAHIVRRLPGKPVDDIHPSHLGIYVAALVHFATLYAANPVGLPHDVQGLPDITAERLQTLVWNVVTREPRTGVRP